MNNDIKFGIYKLLLQLGVKKEDIKPEAPLNTIIPYMHTEWNCFLFFLESKFNIDINEQEEQYLITVGSTIDTVAARIHR